ncbi:hypothetical protein [Paenibacillus sp. HGF5]|uniref:hypothetical protein n=1 Tax=Paenibacillus sp. HGF5 TaxID=908341 RepID=UPI0002071DA0|nr:hypothetical protein [Paenibacillus sp. HGF5]EGG32809.1 hypothetical protein HMPREF9412_1725 [Paenibacillus sp. HGF5]
MKQAQTADSVGFKPLLPYKGRIERKDDAAAAGKGIHRVTETETTTIECKNVSLNATNPCPAA